MVFLHQNGVGVRKGVGAKMVDVWIIKWCRRSLYKRCICMHLKMVGM